MTTRRAPKPSVSAETEIATVEVNTEPRTFEVNMTTVLRDITEQIQERVRDGEDPGYDHAEYVLYGKDFIQEI
jgi:hypothetical protein